MDGAIVCIQDVSTRAQNMTPVTNESTIGYSSPLTQNNTPTKIETLLVFRAPTPYKPPQPQAFQSHQTR